MSVAAAVIKAAREATILEGVVVSAGRMPKLVKVRVPQMVYNRFLRKVGPIDSPLPIDLSYRQTLSEEAPI